MYSYLKNRKQRVQINSIFSAPRTVMARVPSVSIDGTLLSNVFINDVWNNNLLVL